jgi:hypothetical protein
MSAGLSISGACANYERAPRNGARARPVQAAEGACAYGKTTVKSIPFVGTGKVVLVESVYV